MLVLLLQGLIGGPYLPLLALAAALLAGVPLALSLREPATEPPRTDPQPAPV